MSDNLVTSENLSIELLKSIFDDASMETHLGSDGSLYVKDEILLVIRPPEEKDYICFITTFVFKKDLTRLQRLECANNINGCFVGTACPVDDDVLGMDFFLCVKGGVSKKNVVWATKLFLSSCVWAVEEYGSDLIEGIPDFDIGKLSRV